ncbi:MAG: HTH domain-containing protein, partial [Clostridiales bacterium]|nr:HTH domain-containing protein [Clostridiales bacterium]
MSQSTIFAILMILLAKRKVTRDYLAERFSGSKRTVSRYITELIDAGVP